MFVLPPQRRRGRRIVTPEEVAASEPHFDNLYGPARCLRGREFKRRAKELEQREAAEKARQELRGKFFG